ncbi:MAG TPA: DegT/DnrJ/EryC1/StrS family aminotransferase [Gemmataceae bacterium]|nr:DegT/DnrJ/EryC1/StrS family aminotransferase [Gemmataceae bacterium]
MHSIQVSRRRFLQKASAGAAGVTAAASSAFVSKGFAASSRATLAALGGKPVRTEQFPSWPVIEKNDQEAWRKVLEEGKWCRLDGNYANTFEKVYAEKMGTTHCTATSSGTSSLIASLNVLGIGPGDEVLVPPYTFVATINAVLLQHALPVFVDTDRQTSQIDATKIEAAITERTACIMPVHLGGNAADMDAILAIAKKHSLPVIEDTCQSHLGEWRGKKLGSLGTCGCFSFQVSKNLSSGEGGAVISNDADFTERCFTFHNNGHPRKGRRSGFTYAAAGSNLRMTEFQACLLLQQMTRLDEQSRTRDENGRHLTRLLQEIPGIYPAKSYGGCTRNAYHLYMFRYDSEQFAGAPRAKFLKALQAEGIPCSSGYTPLNLQPFLKESLNSRAFKAVYSSERRQAYENNNRCPENDKLCTEAVWFGQTMLLGNQSDMDQIAEAIRKIHDNAAELAKL